VIANRVLPCRPTPAGRAYVLANPRWLWLAFRAAMILVGPLLLYLFYTDASLPLPGQLLAAVVGVGTFCVGVWQRPWDRFEFFVADDEGIAFPANGPPKTTPRGEKDGRWLHVPWKNIDNVRIAVERGDGTRCVAFDVRATPDEKRDFFGCVDRPADRGDAPHGVIHVAFGISPPAPAKTVAALSALRERGETTMAQ
jgi:hypothetical protein